MHTHLQNSPYFVETTAVHLLLWQFFKHLDDCGHLDSILRESSLDHRLREAVRVGLAPGGDVGFREGVFLIDGGPASALGGAIGSFDDSWSLNKLWKYFAGVLVLDVSEDGGVAAVSLPAGALELPLSTRRQGLNGGACIFHGISANLIISIEAFSFNKSPGKQPLPLIGCKNQLFPTTLDSIQNFLICLINQLEGNRKTSKEKKEFKNAQCGSIIYLIIGRGWQDRKWIKIYKKGKNLMGMEYKALSYYIQRMENKAFSIEGNHCYIKWQERWGKPLMNVFGVRLQIIKQLIFSLKPIFKNGKSQFHIQKKRRREGGKSAPFIISFYCF